MLTMPIFSLNFLHKLCKAFSFSFGQLVHSKGMNDSSHNNEVRLCSKQNGNLLWRGWGVGDTAIMLFNPTCNKHFKVNHFFKTWILYLNIQYSMFPPLEMVVQMYHVVTICICKELFMFLNVKNYAITELMKTISIILLYWCFTMLSLDVYYINLHACHPWCFDLI